MSLPRRYDPTGTAGIRRSFVGQMVKRFDWLRGKIWEKIVKKKFFHPDGKFQINVDIPANPHPQFVYSESDAKKQEFMHWLKLMENAGILKTMEGPGREVSGYSEWTNLYIESAYKKGIEDAYGHVAKDMKIQPFDFGTSDDLIRGAFLQPIHADSIGLLYSRAFTELKGITEAMDVHISRVLSRGLIDGKNPRELVRILQKTCNTIGKNRAKTLARTEVIRAHAESTLNVYETAGIQGVELQAEWLAGNDERVCPYCDEMSGQIISIQAARGMIPAHPNCRCSWVPDVTSRKSAEQLDLEAAWAEIEETLEIQKPISEIPSGMDGAQAFGKRLTLEEGQRVGGSTGAKVYKDTEGNEWIVKAYGGNTDQVRNEWIANQIYAKAGVQVPETRLAQVGDTLTIASRRLEDKGTLGWMMEGVPDLDSKWEDVASHSSIIRGFTADAWLANWDVAGTGWDNILVVEGAKGNEFIRIDQGGSLLYRAQGSPKGSAFGKEVKEIFSLRDPEMNTYSARLFRGISDEKIAKQIGTLFTNISDKNVREIIKQSGLGSTKAQVIQNTLTERRRWMLEWKKQIQGVRVKLPSKEEIGKRIEAEIAQRGPLRFTQRDFAALQREGGIGKSFRIDAREIEDQQIHFWIEKMDMTQYRDPRMQEYFKGIGYRPEGNNFETMRAKLKVLRPDNDIGAKDFIEFIHQNGQRHLVTDVGFTELEYGERWRNAGNQKLMGGEFVSEKVGFETYRIFEKTADGVIEVRWYTGQCKFIYGTKEEEVFALKNYVEVLYHHNKEKRCQETSMNQILDKLGEMKLNIRVATDLDKEEYYLRTIFHSRRTWDTVFKGMPKRFWEDTPESQEKRVDYLRQHLDRQVPGALRSPKYNPNGWTQEGGGYIRFDRPDLTDEQMKKLKDLRIIHDSRDPITMIRAVVENEGRVYSTTERYFKGVNVKGQSSYSDLKTGGADYVFTRLRQGKTQQSAAFQWKGEKLAETGIFSYPDDRYGNVKLGYHYKERVTSPEGWEEIASLKSNGEVKYYDNETMFKHSMSFKDLEAIVVEQARHKDEILEAFAEMGIEEIEGRPVEEIVKVEWNPGREGSQ